ncbi:DnaJ domain-containing protein [Cytophagaceae bacterium ABcell3]|nr:DnaJ domain-containing protein [Cytophagaceae bacterium ABcell3]
MQEFQSYNILNLTPGASEEEIRKAYRKKAKAYHPDVNDSPDAREKFLMVKRAYDSLLHLKKNQRYFSETNTTAPAQYDFSRYKNPFTRINIEGEAAKRKRAWEAFQAQKRAEEKFQRTKKKLQNSMWFYPAKIGLYASVALSWLFSVLIIAGCLAMVIFIHPVVIFFLIPFITGSIFLLLRTYEWFNKYKEMFE